jgi:hypothetical protein
MGTMTRRPPAGRSADPESELVRLPRSIGRVVRRYALQRSITFGEAVGELIQRRKQWSLVDVLGMAHDRLVDRQEELVELLQDEDSGYTERQAETLVEDTIEGLSELYDELAGGEDEDGEDGEDGDGDEDGDEDEDEGEAKDGD